MDWKTLFFGFDGRIGRRTWWLASIFLFSSATALTLLVNPKRWLGAPPNPADTLISLAMIIPETAVSVKRFNDRGWPQWLPYGFAVIIVLLTLLLHFQLILERDPMTLADAVIVISVVGMVLAIIIDNGLLRGTRGSNRYGPDPLQPETTPTSRADEKNPHAA